MSKTKDKPVKAKPKPKIDYKAKYEKCIAVLMRLDAGIISMYDL